MPPRPSMPSARFHAFGGPEVIRIEQVPVPQPGPGETLIEVRAVALNHVDLWVRRGLPIQTTMPHIGGSDIAGVVVELGDGAEGPEPGTRVVVNPALSCGRCRECRRGELSLCPDFRILGEHTDGGLAGYVVAPSANLYPIPDGISFEVAAALPVSYQTAWRALIGQAALRAGEDVLILGASGGTALAAVQIALLAGARVFAVSSGPEKTDRLRALGVHRAYDRERLDFSREVFADTGRRGVDVVVENVGAATWDQSVRALAPGGRLVTYGATTGASVQLDLRRLFWKQHRLIGSTMASLAEFEAMLKTAFSGKLAPIIDSTFPLERTRAAHERLESGQQFGKVMVRVGE